MCFPHHLQNFFFSSFFWDEAEINARLVRIMREGQMDVFATGCYRDKVRTNGDGSLRFAERIVVCDGSRFDTLVAIPF